MASPGLPKSPEQSEKSKKYDRQLRLWGDHGQLALEGAHICLINATATGTETLKSLVLPGIGAFTVVDGHKVTGEDVGNNFFLERDSVGKSRAQVATQLLLELNPDVRGDYIDESPELLMQNSPDFFLTFTVVIASAVSERIMISLSRMLWDANIPFVVCRSYGLIGYIRIQTQEHTVIESHPDNTLDDLRLDRPFEGLQAYMNSMDLESMDKKHHSHTPYIVLLYKYLQQWLLENRGKPPRTYKEKQAFKQLLQKGIWKNKEGVPEEEENFEEAIKATNTALIPTVVPSSVQQILHDVNTTNLTTNSKPFWIMARAVKEFIDNEGEGALPVRGIIPDMIADSQRYIALQNVYREQAVHDIELVHRRVQQLLLQLGRSPDSITENDVHIFCKNTHSLQLVRNRSIADEYESKAINMQEVSQNLENPDSEIVYYVMLRGVDRFYSEHGVYPGAIDDQVEHDITKLKSCVSRLLHEWGCSYTAKDEFVHEFCRYGAAELHSVAAFIGGCTAHEVIKLTTGQYVPLDNTYIYNAMTSASATFRL